MRARYRFAVRFRLVTSAEHISVDPAEFETQLFYEAPDPDDSEWLFFRDVLWRGELSSPDDFRDRVADVLGVSVADVEFRAFETDQEYRRALEAAIEANLDAFNATSVRDVISKYFGSAIEVESAEDV